jgi:hypothetical protein
MPMTRYRTDRRLWLWISFAIFVAIWCLVPVEIKIKTYRPVVILWFWIGDIFRLGVLADEVVGLGTGLLIFGLMSSIVAIVIAWPLQGLVMLVRARRLKTKKAL